MKKIEIICWTTILLLIILRVMFVLPFFLVPIILFVGFVMGAVYFFLSFLLLNEIHLKTMFQKGSYKSISFGRILGSIFLGFAYATATIATVFASLCFPGGTIMIYMSSVPILVSLFLSLYKLKKYKESNFYKGIIKRDILILSVCLVFIAISFLPKETRSKIFPYPQSHTSERN